VFIKSDGIYLRLSFDEIDYIKAYGEYVKIHKDGKWSLASCTMKSLEEKLPQRLFCRVHKSYIVRLDRIQSFDSTHLRLLDTVIPIGRGHKVQFEKAITKIS
jgi:DNA-binding LytR/AlgR family response regulator